MCSTTDDDDAQEEEDEEIEGVRVPCRDAKRRVWQEALDLLGREKQKKTHDARKDTAAATPVEQPSTASPLPKKDSRCRAAEAGGDIP